MRAPNIENYFTYSATHYEMITHIFTLGVGCMAAGLVYFLVTAQFTHPKYRLTSYLSGVVMVSAALILYNQLNLWESAFTFDGTKYVLTDVTFNNGYRYVNWSIDVPMLLTQMLIVLGISGAAFRKKFIAFTLAALLMIWTGYYGQYFEVYDFNTFMIWGAISTVFFVYINYLVGMTVFRNLHKQPENTRFYWKALFWLLIISWTLYPIAYLMPWISPTESGMVVRQYIFTTADISSKVIYGVILGRIATLKSAAEGHELSRENVAANNDKEMIYN